MVMLREHDARFTYVYLFDALDDVAVDWINDKLYWTDTVHARIEVADLADSSMRKVLLQTGGNTLPRAIVVDPRNR